jgi:5-formyltetrahydrofolate cyclo-ligase
VIQLDRHTLIEKRQAITGQQRRTKEQAIIQKITPFLKGNVAAYSPIRGEVDLLSFLDHRNIYLPCTVDENRIAFYPISKTMHKGAFQVMEPIRSHEIEPEELDVILVPLVGFKDCFRIGYGKGYYDRYLPRTKAVKIGVAFDCQEMESIEIKPTDVELDMVVTESRIIRR